jgi:hypothetical protein
MRASTYGGIAKATLGRQAIPAKPPQIGRRDQVFGSGYHRAQRQAALFFFGLGFGVSAAQTFQHTPRHGADRYHPHFAFRTRWSRSRGIVFVGHSDIYAHLQEMIFVGTKTPRRGTLSGPSRLLILDKSKTFEGLVLDTVERCHMRSQDLGRFCVAAPNVSRSQQDSRQWLVA